MGIFKRLAQNRQVKAWRRSLALDAHETVFNQLYQAVDGFFLSKKARQQHGDAFEYVYGEIEFEPFIALLSLCRPDAQTIFYDLGCGVGKAVLAFQMVFQGQKSCGIELFSELHSSALAQKTALMQQPGYQKPAEAIAFLQGDFLTYPLGDANLVFINSTAFLGDCWQKISQYLEQQLPVGAQVISSSKALRSEAFQVIHRTQVRMSFGIVQVYIHRRL